MIAYVLRPVFVTVGILLMALAGPGLTQAQTAKNRARLNAGFVCLEKVYNSELMAPFDILQHSVYRDANDYMTSARTSLTK